MIDQPTDQKPSELDFALQELREAKAAEDEARAARLIAEERVITQMGDLKDEGTNKAETEYFKVQVLTKLNRTITDAEALAEALPEQAYSQLVRHKPSLDLKALRGMQEKDPELYAKAAQFITAKPAKPTVKMEVL